MNLRRRSPPIGDLLGIAPRTFLVVGAEHKRAPLLLRDRLQGDESDALRLLSRCREMGLDQAMVLGDLRSLRSLGRRHRRHAALPQISRRSSPKLPAAPVREIAPQLHYLSDDAALRYAFAVAASLESQVIGEPQVLGQVKEAYRLASRAGMSGSTAGCHPAGGPGDGRSACAAIPISRRNPCRWRPAW